MNNNNLFAFTGLFDTPNDIIKAAEKVSEEGYTKYDVNTPYPIHGMDKAMKLPPSKLGYAALVFGLSGTVSALLFMFWMSVIDYPVIIGGKPFFSFPAYVPIIFEVTVLSAAVATVVTMLFIFFKFPNISHPLHNTEYMKCVSSDKYGICIQTNDPIFNEAKVKTLFESLGAKSITQIYFDEEELTTKHILFQPKFIGFLIITSIVVSLVTYFSLNKLMFMEPFNWMMYQDKIISQSESSFFSDGRGMREPVKGTIARGFLPYQFSGQPEKAGRLLVNPLSFTKENLILGKKKYDIYCSPCHGYFGEGDSRLKGQFPNPPSLHSEKVINWSDGSIFHVITDGQNIMPSYSSQMNREERWATVLYIRALQRSLNAKESDLQ
jgi:hypothetical protein